MSNSWTCNIEKKGRWIRAVVGLIFCGLAAWLWFVKDNTFWSIGFAVFGVFSLLEALRGWCALRALGFRTPF